MKNILLLAFLLLTQSAFCQIVKGLTFGNTYTVQRISEIHADKEVQVEKFGSNGSSRRIEIRLSENQYHYLLIELDNYAEGKGGRLNRIMLSHIPYDEANRHFNNWLSTHGEPSRGYEEVETYPANSYTTTLYNNKAALYIGKRIPNDALAVRVGPNFGESSYIFEVAYSSNYRYLGNIVNASRESNISHPERWSITRTYGAGSKVRDF